MEIARQLIWSRKQLLKIPHFSNVFCPKTTAFARSVAMSTQKRKKERGALYLL